VRVGVVDIGTNSMRLLITSDVGEVGRWVEVTGLGRGVDATGELGEPGMSRSLAAFEGFAELLDENDVAVRKAIATSASRDAANREAFFDRVEEVLGVRPDLITGEEEARYAFLGATGGSAAAALVSDIGGGSTEFVTADRSTSVQVGSVRLTDRILGPAPAGADRVSTARAQVRSLFENISFEHAEIIGVAGTWTSLSAIVQGLNTYEPDQVHGSFVSLSDLGGAIEDMTSMTQAELEAIPSLDPKRAPVILGGGIVAEGVLVALGSERAKISERDTLDGVADELMA
jgi:exopolyphosphatase / guanosine-5'-triphosphate,3'-diphosphate pyrophosphatase